MLNMLCGRKQFNFLAAWRKRGVELVLTVGKIYEKVFIFIRPFARDGRPPFDPGHNRHLVTFHTYTLLSNPTHNMDLTTLSRHMMRSGE